MNITKEERWAIDTVITNARARALATQSNFLDSQIEIASSCIERMIAEQPEPDAKPFPIEVLEKDLRDNLIDLNRTIFKDDYTSLEAAIDECNRVLDKIAELKGKS
jgi:uncharacterized protein HemY